jgi:hypothetical protein
MANADNLLKMFLTNGGRSLEGCIRKFIENFFGFISCYKVKNSQKVKWHLDRPLS